MDPVPRSIVSLPLTELEFSTIVARKIIDLRLTNLKAWYFGLNHGLDRELDPERYLWAPQITKLCWPNGAPPPTHSDSELYVTLLTRCG